MKRHSEDLQPPKWIDASDFQFLCFNLAKELMEFSEPIPNYETRDNSLLESALSAPRLAYEFSNSSLEEQASILFYSLIKNHPFKNGNKRIAVMALLIFLTLNKKWLDIPPSFLYKIAVLVAESPPFSRDIVVAKNSEEFSKYIVDL